MSLLHQTPDWISPEEYLEAEKDGQIRHEYFAGEMYAMSGASRNHNLISLDLATALNAHLRGKSCQVFSNDMKVHLEHQGENWYYYPDVMVSCDRTGQREYFCDTPAIIFEVLSKTTAQIDRHEKRLAYRLIASLHTYVLVEQTHVRVTVFRRSSEGEWESELLTKADEILHLPQIEFSLPVAQIYERAEL